MTVNEMKKCISAKDLSGVYYFYGAEKYLIKKYTADFLEAFDGNFSDINVQMFDADDLDMQKIFDAVSAVPFMSDKKCVYISRFNVDQMDQASMKSFQNILQDVPESTIVLITQGLEAPTKKISSKQKKFLSFFEKVGNVVEFAKLRRSDLAKFLEIKAQKQNVVLQKKLSYDIIERCTDDLNILSNEMDKLCAYVGEGKEITQQDLDDVLVCATESNVFELSKAIMAKNISLAHERLEYLFQKREEPVAILAVIASTFIDLYRVKVMNESRRSPREIEKYFNYKGKSFKIDIAAREGTKFSILELREKISKLVQTDLQLKSSKVSSRVILDLLLNDLCR